MRKHLSAVLGFLFLFSWAFPARAAAPSYPDIEGNWARPEIETAASEGWVSGYSDGTFRPDDNVARAEFVKLLLAATRLTPGSPTADFLHNASTYAASGMALTDMESGWLTQQGWTQVAVDFGLVLPTDYPGGEFLPAQSLTRNEAAVMIVRALGLVYSAQKPSATALPFADAETVPPSVRGYVREAVKAGVITGLPDGRFGGDKPITRAEAVTLISRTLAYMEEGIDPDIKAYAQTVPDGRRMEIPLSVPAQIVGSSVYLPARDVIAANAALYGDCVESFQWDPGSQQGSFTLVKPFQFGAGDARYEVSFNPIGDYAWTFPVPALLLYGELMIPVYTPGNTAQTNLWTDAHWDAAAKVLTVSLPERYATGS